MNKLFSTLRLSALMLAMIGTAAHATTPGTITPEQDDTAQQEQNDTAQQEQDDSAQQDQNQNDDGFIEEEDDQTQDDQGQDQDDNYGDGYEDDQGQNQDDNWGNDDQNGDQYDRGQGGKNQNDRGQGGKNQGGKGQDDKGYDIPGKPGRDYGKPRYDRRPRRLVETVNVNQLINGGARLPLNMLVNNLRRFQGMRLVNVVINGSSDAGMGMAVFCASQCGQMQNVGYYRTAYPIRTTGERISPRANQWFLELRGNFWIESIQLEFIR